MKAKGLITILGKTRSGYSAATGNQWFVRDIVIEFDNEDGRKNIMFLAIKSEDLCDKADRCMVGDVVELSYTSWVRSKNWTTPEGEVVPIRTTELLVTDISKVDEAGF